MTNSERKSRNRPKTSLSSGSLKETDISVTDPSVLQTLAGSTDDNLRIVERELELEIERSPKGLRIKGNESEVDLGADLLQQLTSLLERGEKIWPGDIERCIRMLSGNRNLRLEELFRDQVKIAGRSYTIVPKTFRQKVYIEAIRGHDIVFSIGPAGTGKTYLAMAMAIAALLNKEVKRVVLCRPAVEAGEKLGFLPGDMAEKVNPYLRPLYDAMHDMVDHERATEMVAKGQVEVAPLAFMRGRTLSNAFVILDEAQNTTPVQMKMFLTRLGRNSKCVVTGDITQIDLPKGSISGLIQVLKILKGVKGLSFIYFTEEDVIRHPLVSRIIAAYAEDEEKQRPQE